MRRHSSAVFMILALLGALPARADRYVVVFAPGAPAVTDEAIARLGGAVLSRLVGRMDIEMSPQAIAELRGNPSVAYVQHVGPEPVDEAPRARALAKHGAVADFAPPTWFSGEYKYDGAGNIYAIGTTTAPASDGSKNSYTYDASSRLSSWMLAGGQSARTEAYDYDPYGNMTAITLNGTRGPIDVDAATNRLASRPYDAGGNLTLPYTDQSVTYDALNMATTSTIAGADTKYIYDGDDERVGVLRGDTWTWSIRGGDHQILRQYSSSESSPGTAWLWLEDYVYREGILLAAVRQPELGGRRHFHLDHLGTPHLITADDGSQISQHDYTPWGVELTSPCQETTQGYDRNELRVFTGHERDYRISCGDTQVLDYMHARYYNPNGGRFVSVDPVPGSLLNSQSWNRYAYVLDNAINTIDPYGMNGQAILSVYGTPRHTEWKWFSWGWWPANWDNPNPTPENTLSVASDQFLQDVSSGQFSVVPGDGDSVSTAEPDHGSSNLGANPIKAFAAFGDGLVAGSLVGGSLMGGPLADRGVYDPEQYQIARSEGYAIRGVAEAAMAAVTAAELGASQVAVKLGAIFGPYGPLLGRGGKATGGILNRNDWLRVGWAWDPNRGVQYIRIGILNEERFGWVGHIPLWP
jgi:RHS repeat-associated protein